MAEDLYREWMCCEKCREVTSYIVDHVNDTTTIERGHYLAHGLYSDYITTGFESREEAQKWLDEHPLKVE